MISESVSVVIPVYNSEATLNEVVETLHSTFAQRIEFEIILVDDYSLDGSFEQCKLLADKFPFVKAIRLNRNFGQQNAKMAGLRFAKGDYIVFMDDDLQNPPEQIFLLIDEIRKGYDVVFSFSRKKEQSFFKNMGSKANDLMARWLLGKPKWLRFSSYYIFRKLIAAEIIKYSGSFPYIGGTILQLTTNISQVEIEHRPRKAGRSNYSFRKLVGLWLNGFTSFSILPLRLASLTGFLFCIMASIAIMFLIVRKLLHPASILGGWTSIMVVLLFISGIQMVFLGIIGEYVGRILFWVNSKPQYVIKETILKK